MLTLEKAGEFEKFGFKDVDFCFTKGYRRLRIGETWDCKDCYELSKR